MEKPANDPQGKGRTHATVSSIAWLGRLRTLMRVIAAIAPFMCEVAGSPVLESSARAQTAAHSEAVDRFAKFIKEASGRFAVPARWIPAVMQVESSGDEHAISSRGAVGLMQLIPGTWVELSVRYGLGLDPFDAHDNIIAGAAYLKEMHDRFGSAGFLHPITQAQRGINSTSRQADRFQRKPQLTLRQSRHCSVTDIVNTR
jgi:soluble lytic murein transglycosylase-like protein